MEMSRKIVRRSLNNTMAIIVDGKDEKWYIETVKKHYQAQCPALKRVKIEPNLPQQKKIQELFALAEAKHAEGYKHIVLVVDLDAIITDPKEMQKFNDLYNKYVSVGIGKASSRNKWMRGLTLILNNPCVEYWYLIHFKFTNKFFGSYEALKPELQKYLSGYEKSEAYYKGNPDIYSRLGGDKGLSIARQNAKKFSAFDLATCQTVGISEMNKLFDIFDEL